MNSRAFTRYRLGEFDKVITDCEDALTLDPASAETYWFRGLARKGGVRIIEKSLTDFAQARRCLRRNSGPQ